MIFHIIVTFSAIVVRSRCCCDFSRVQILCSMSVARQIIVNHDTVSTKVSTPHTHLSLFHKQSSGNSSSRKKQWSLLTTCWSYRAASCFLTARMALPESCITTNGKRRSLHRSLSVWPADCWAGGFLAVEAAPSLSSTLTTTASIAATASFTGVSPQIS